MAKKRTAKTPAAPPKQTKPAKGTKSAKGTKKKAPAATEIVLDAVEEKAYDLAHSSAAVCKELEVEATAALTQAVRRVYKAHGLTLSAEQASRVTMILFGD